MNRDTILQLNQLNQKFYQTTATDFDQSRQYFWQGWSQLHPHLELLAEKVSPLGVLDLGCGNARFAKFLNQKLNVWMTYHGVDSDRQLLNAAKQTLAEINLSAKLDHLDLVKRLLNNELTSSLQDEYDLIVAFGLIHHVPGHETRKSLLQTLSKILAKNGRLVVTAWQFGGDSRFDDRKVDPQQAGIKPDKLEKNDFILDWRRGETAYRYCHWLQPEEMEQLTVKTGLKVDQKFSADGKSNQLNDYYLLKKP